MQISLRVPTQAEHQLLSKWRTSTFLVMLFGYIGYYLCRKNLSAAFPLMSEAFGFSNTDLGLIALSSEIAYAAGKFINGPLGDQLGGRKIFLLGMLGALLSNFAFSMGGSLPYFIIVWCICRYFLSMGWGGLTKVIGSWYEPEKNGTVMGLISLNFQFGGVIATLFAGLLVAQGLGWQAIFIYPPIVLAVIFAWSYFASKGSPDDVVPGTNFGKSETGKVSLIHAEDPTEDRRPIDIIKGLLGIKMYRQLLVYSFLTTFLRSIFFFWTPKLLVDLGLGTSNAILKSALFPFLGGLGTIFLGWYTDKRAKEAGENRATAMWKMLCGLIVSLGLISWQLSLETFNPNVIVGLVGMCGLFLLGPYSMSSGCLSLDIAGSHAAGSSTGMIDGLGYIGGAIAVWGAGVLSDKLGWAEVFLVLTLFSILATYSAYLMSKKE